MKRAVGDWDFGLASANQDAMLHNAGPPADCAAVQPYSDSLPTPFS